MIPMTMTMAMTNETRYGTPSTLPSDPCPREGEGEGKGEGDEGKDGGHCHNSCKDATIAATINHRHSWQRRHWSHQIIPLSPPLTMTAVAAINDHHRRCHTVDNNDRQKPAVVVHCWRQQRQTSLTEAAVNGNRGNGGLCQQRSLSMVARVEWRDDDAMALLTMASSADGGSGNGGGRHQLCSSSWCPRHHPFIGVDGGGKDAIAAAAINCRFY
jgi:hypothetical protein